MSSLAVMVSGALLLAVPPVRAQGLAFDRGASGLHQKLLDLQSAASLLHTTAHPDDEHGGMLTRLARGEGVRVALLSLTRGEAGANAVGPELFDALGWIRAEELSLAGTYYGLDALYFTRLADYGYSKRLEEAVEEWGRDAALEQMVRILRMERPLVVVSRFRGDARDGHGQHQFAGALTREAFRAAADPDRFPEQIAAGLRPWQALKLYVGGAREEERWSVAFDSGAYSHWLGDSYENVARSGLSLQRSQTSGRLRRVRGAFVRYYERVESGVGVGEKESGFFDGIDTSLSGVAQFLGASASIMGELEAIEREAREALESFDPHEPARVVASLVRGLFRTRRALDAGSSASELAPLLAQKETQFTEAIELALGVQVSAIAVPFGASEASSSPFAPPPVMGPAVPGQELELHVSATHGASTPLRITGVSVHVPPGSSVDGELGAEVIRPGEALERVLAVRLADDAATWAAHVTRSSIAENQYQGAGDWWRAAPPPAAVVRVDYDVEGEVVSSLAAVRRLESAAPYGDVERELTILPALSIHTSPGLSVAPVGERREVGVDVTVSSFHPDGARGQLSLDLPDGYEAEPELHEIELGRAEESATWSFRVRTPAVEAGAADRIRAVVRSGGVEYRDGYRPIQHRDLETRYVVEAAETRILGVDLEVPPGLHVGYVMGVGDEVPAAIEELGATVTLLSRSELASGSLDAHDAIVVGTRAYAVRDDLRTHNARLLDYVERGGHLVVLYNTSELDPGSFAPYAGELPEDAEEVSEEDARVVLLSRDHPLLTWPNRIDESDFGGWVEQRGSKFWSAWDDRYAALVESADAGQAPQRGGWLWCRYGEGTYTYFAYALHRQLPHGVPGAYRILANLLSQRRRP